MEFNYIEIVDRMIWSARLKNDSAVARVLGKTPQALSNYKKRGAMPTSLIIKFCEIYGLSVDWILTGTGEMYKEGYIKEKSVRDLPLNKTSGMEEMKTIITDDELIIIAKVLKILRSEDGVFAVPLKGCVEGLLNSIGT